MSGAGKVESGGAKRACARSARGPGPLVGRSRASHGYRGVLDCEEVPGEPRLRPGPRGRCARGPLARAPSGLRAFPRRRPCARAAPRSRGGIWWADEAFLCIRSASRGLRRSARAWAAFSAADLVLSLFPLALPSSSSTACLAGGCAGRTASSRSPSCKWRTKPLRSVRSIGTTSRCCLTRGGNGLRPCSRLASSRAPSTRPCFRRPSGALVPSSDREKIGDRFLTLDFARRQTDEVPSRRPDRPRTGYPFVIRGLSSPPAWNQIKVRLSRHLAHRSTVDLDARPPGGWGSLCSEVN